MTPSNPHSKPILCMDFDGVIHSYESGWKGADRVDDPPVPGAFEFLMAASEVFEVHIYSSRSNQAGGIEAMQAWMIKHIHDEYVLLQQDAEIFVMNILYWPTAKPAAMVSIDDRALTFTGEWPDINAIRRFRPWNKKE